MRSSLPSGKSATPPARCIHRPQRDTSSAGYRLLVSRASCGASREPEARRSPAHPSSDRLRGSLRSGDTIPHTCAVSPTFLYGAFFFVASALAALSSARLTAYGNNAQTCILQRFHGVCHPILPFIFLLEPVLHGHINYRLLTRCYNDNVICWYMLFRHMRFSTMNELLPRLVIKSIIVRTIINAD